MVCSLSMLVGGVYDWLIDWIVLWWFVMKAGNCKGKRPMSKVTPYHITNKKKMSDYVR